MHNYYKKNNVSLLNNLNSASKVAEYRKKARGRLTSSHLYHYCSNNPVRYVDPTGAFDDEAFLFSLKDLFNRRKEKYSVFNCYNTYQISKSYYEYCFENISYLKEGVILTNSEGRYYIEIPSEFSKLSTNEKLRLLNTELTSLQQQFDSSAPYFESSVSDMIYNLGEALFSIASYTSIEEFALNYIFNNIENIADITQFDIEGVNLVMDISYIKSLITKYMEEN